MNVSIHCMIII